MTVEVDPKETGRASAYMLWMQAPNPMVTFFKTLDVTNLVKLIRKRNLKYNMLMDYCIGKAASDIEEFYTLPVGEKLIRYDSIAVNTIIKNKNSQLNSCDLVFSKDLDAFNKEYVRKVFTHPDDIKLITDLLDQYKEGFKETLDGIDSELNRIKNIKFGINGTK